jgi:biopolymer transport protein ExbD
MPLKTHLDDEPTLNLTAMLDVMFLLIIFFMLGTKFVEDEERNIKLNVPVVVDSRGMLVRGPARRVVNVDRQGNITLGNDPQQTPLSLDELAAQLRAAQNEYQKERVDLGVLVRSDAENKIQRVAEVLTACKQAGIKDLNLTVRTVSPQK